MKRKRPYRCLPCSWITAGAYTHLDVYKRQSGRLPQNGHPDHRPVFSVHIALSNLPAAILFTRLFDGKTGSELMDTINSVKENATHVTA